MKNIIYILAIIALTSFGKNPNNFVNINLDDIHQSNIFKYSSNSNDLEDQYRILQTNNEITYHTFDFNKNMVTMKSQNKEGKWISHDFKIKRKRITESLTGAKGMEFDIDNPNCFQIWIDSVGSIGYEFKNGQKLVFYGVRQIN